MYLASLITLNYETPYLSRHGNPVLICPQARNIPSGEGIFLLFISSKKYPVRSITGLAVGTFLKNIEPARKKAQRVGHQRLNAVRQIGGSDQVAPYQERLIPNRNLVTRVDAEAGKN